MMVLSSLLNNHSVPRTGRVLPGLWTNIVLACCRWPNCLDDMKCRHCLTIIGSARKGQLPQMVSKYCWLASVVLLYVDWRVAQTLIKCRRYLTTFLPKMVDKCRPGVTTIVCCRWTNCPDGGEPGGQQAHQGADGRHLHHRGQINMGAGQIRKPSKTIMDLYN